MPVKYLLRMTCMHSYFVMGYSKYLEAFHFWAIFAHLHQKRGDVNAFVF
uniref:Uncharacterized protein n=1 Tax=Anguilla anguilla TaxID=7936 RepID=A0A0E9X2M3_ANGAN